MKNGNINMLHFLEKNPFIKTIQPTTRQKLAKNVIIGKNDKDFLSFLSKVNNHFSLSKIQKVETEKAIIAANHLEKKTWSSPNSQKNSFFEIEEEQVEYNEQEIAEDLFKKILADEKAVWDNYSYKEKDWKKEIANFQAKIFILQKNLEKIRKKNITLGEQNIQYEERVKEAFVENDLNDKVKKIKLFEFNFFKKKAKFQTKLNTIQETFMINEELYTNIKSFVGQNMQEMEEKSFNQTKKKMEEERIIEKHK